jgi:GTP-binding protein
VEDLQNLRREIDLYDPALSSRLWLVVANKMDLPDAERNLDAMQERFPRIKIIPTSAAKGQGMNALKETLAAAMTNDKDMVSAGI